MEKNKVSVILPSLNVREYIRECLESAVNQTLKEIEIICVDAGSTDGTIEVISEYANRDERIKVIISDIKSYGYQMNLGIDNANGDYIGILETDDVLSLNMYEELYEVANGNDVDFVKADFYRFSGTGESISKAYVKLADCPDRYYRVVDIQTEQEAFDYPMNIWSGIYKRQFLIDNNIRHNETPGASFQDNGFWFQTFMYSRRAYFIDKPYYMNRRDNANSSVYSKGKVFCICDEYDYIYDVLKRDAKNLQEYGRSFASACFRAYKANLDRISDEYSLDFIKRWSEDFRKYKNEGLLDNAGIIGYNWEMLMQIIDDPEGYYRKVAYLEKQFLKEVALKDCFIIYGAGQIGKKSLDKLENIGLGDKVVSFAVTKKDDNIGNYNGIPINGVDDLVEYRNKACVIVATADQHRKDIVNTLKDKCFEDIIFAPYK